MEARQLVGVAMVAIGLLGVALAVFPKLANSAPAEFIAPIIRVVAGVCGASIGLYGAGVLLDTSWPQRAGLVVAGVWLLWTGVSGGRRCYRPLTPEEEAAHRELGIPPEAGELTKHYRLAFYAGIAIAGTMLLTAVFLKR